MRSGLDQRTQDRMGISPSGQVGMRTGSGRRAVICEAGFHPRHSIRQHDNRCADLQASWIDRIPSRYQLSIVQETLFGPASPVDGIVIPVVHGGSAEAACPWPL
jgi:hypothetical protein